MLCAVHNSSLGESHPASPAAHMLSPCGMSSPHIFEFAEESCPSTLPPSAAQSAAASRRSTSSRRGSSHVANGISGGISSSSLSNSNSNGMNGHVQHHGSNHAAADSVSMSASGICVFHADRFVDVKVLGHGSFSRVHEGLDKATGRQVALKTLLIADATLVHEQRYVEALSNRVLHPNNNNNTANGNAGTSATAPAAIITETDSSTDSGSSDGGSNNSSRRSSLAAELIAEGIRPSSMQDALREIEIASTLHHPNIAAVFGYFMQSRDTLVMVQELCAVGDIFTIMNPDGLSPLVSANLVPQALAGLAFIHSQGLVHMDMKPENMLIARGSVLKICDFGSVVKAGVVLDFAIGTLQYVSPELVQACQTGRPLRAHTSMDMFALGQIMFIMLTGRFMWECAADTDANYRMFAGRGHVRRRPWCLFPDVLRLFLESLVQVDHLARPTALQAKEFVDKNWLVAASEFKNRMKALTGPKSSSKSGTL